MSGALDSPLQYFEDYLESTGRLTSQWAAVIALALLWMGCRFLSWLATLRREASRAHLISTETTTTEIGSGPGYDTTERILKLERACDVLRLGLLLLLTSTAFTSLPLMHNCLETSKFDGTLDRVGVGASSVLEKLDIQSVVSNSTVTRAPIVPPPPVVWPPPTETITTPSPPTENPKPTKDPKPIPQPPAPPVEPRCHPCLGNSVTLATTVLNWVFFWMIIIWFALEVFATDIRTLEVARVIIVCLSQPLILIALIIAAREWMNLKMNQCN